MKNEETSHFLRDDVEMAGTVYWITGLSGAGKTTVGQALYKRIKGNKDNVVILDGDALRKAIAQDLGYTYNDRHESAFRNARLCKLLGDQNIDVICCTISMFEDVRQWSRGSNEKYIEVYLKTSMETLKCRNQKNLYREAQDELVGLGIEMEEPTNPDLVVINDGVKNPEEVVDEIVRKAEEKGF